MAELVNVFISYAHEDRTWCSRLRDQLGALVNLGRIRLFDDGEIRPGERWDARIRQELASADIIVLIVSDKFLASKYSTTVELRHAVEEEGSKPLCVIPVVADHVDLGALPFKDFQLFPVDASRDVKPLVDWKDDSSKALAEIAGYVRQEVDRIRGGGGTMPAVPRRPAPRRVPSWLLASAALLLAVAVAMIWSRSRPAESPDASTPPAQAPSAAAPNAPVSAVPIANPPPRKPSPAGDAQSGLSSRPRGENGTTLPAAGARPADGGPRTGPADPPRDATPAPEENRPPAATPAELRRQLFARADSVVQCVRQARNDGLTMQVLRILRTSATSLTTSGLLADLDNAWPAGASEEQQRAIADTVNCVPR